MEQLTPLHTSILRLYSIGHETRLSRARMQLSQKGLIRYLGDNKYEITQKGLDTLKRMENEPNRAEHGA